MYFSIFNITQFTSSHKDCLQLLKKEVLFIASIILYYKTHLVQDLVLNASKYQRVETFTDGDFVYLLAPHASFPSTGTTRFSQGYVGPSVTDTVLDSTHYKLRDLENRLLIDTFHINRLKLVFVSTPADTVNTQQQLNKAFQVTNTLTNSPGNIKPKCDTHEIQVKIRELLGFRYIGHSDLYYSICRMWCVWYTPGEQQL